VTGAGGSRRCWSRARSAGTGRHRLDSRARNSRGTGPPGGCSWTARTEGGVQAERRRAELDLGGGPRRQHGAADAGEKGRSVVQALRAGGCAADARSRSVARRDRRGGRSGRRGTREAHAGAGGWGRGCERFWRVLLLRRRRARAPRGRAPGEEGTTTARGRASARLGRGTGRPWGVGRGGRGRGAGALGAGERQLQERRLGLNVGGAAPAALAALGGGKESRRLGGECRGRGRSAGVWRGDGGRRALLGAGRVGVGWSRWWRRDGRCRGEKIGGGGGCAEGAGEGRREQGEAGGWRERPTAGEKKLTLVL
jgi:hypothetical protein